MPIRPARFEDGLFVWALSQDPSVAKWRVNSEPFSLESHMAFWMRSFLSDIWKIAEDKQHRPVAYGRWRKGEFSLEVSVAVHPGFREMGYGTELVKSVKSAVALIDKDNTPSLRLFKKCGYSEPFVPNTHMRNNKEWLVYVR